MGGNRSQARKWYRGDQNLEVKTESQSLTIGSGKPGCINCYLHRLVVYHFRKPTDDDENRIVTGALPTMSRYWERLQVSIVFPGNEFSSFLSSQLSFDNFRNVGQAMEMHNSLNIFSAIKLILD